MGVAAPPEAQVCLQGPLEAPFPINSRNALEKKSQAQTLPSSLVRIGAAGLQGSGFPWKDRALPGLLEPEPLCEQGRELGLGLLRTDITHRAMGPRFHLVVLSCSSPCLRCFSPAFVVLSHFCSLGSFLLHGAAPRAGAWVWKASGMGQEVGMCRVKGWTCWLPPTPSPGDEAPPGHDGGDATLSVQTLPVLWPRRGCPAAGLLQRWKSQGQNRHEAELLSPRAGQGRERQPGQVLPGGTVG